MALIQGSPSSNSDNTTPDGVSQYAGTAQAVSQTAPGFGTVSRLAASGLATGAANVLQDIAGRVFNFDFRSANGSPIDPDADWRVRISMAPFTASLFYNNQSNAMMYPLSQTKGVIFPYTPTITITHTAKYGATPLTHSNYSSYSYEGSQIEVIGISADFTVQNIEEGQYLMAAIHFFRTCTKMFYGNSPFAGTPPPMVFLNGYGPAYLPNVPCVVTSFSHTMPSDVDYIEVPIGMPITNIAGNQINTVMAGARTRLPTTSQLQISLQPVYSRRNIADNFTLEKYGTGLLNERGFL